MQLFGLACCLRVYYYVLFLYVSGELVKALCVPEGRTQIFTASTVYVQLSKGATNRDTPTQSFWGIGYKNVFRACVFFFFLKN